MNYPEKDNNRAIPFRRHLRDPRRNPSKRGSPEKTASRAPKSRFQEMRGPNTATVPIRKRLPETTGLVCILSWTVCMNLDTAPSITAKAPPETRRSLCENVMAWRQADTGTGPISNQSETSTPSEPRLQVYSLVWGS